MNAQLRHVAIACGLLFGLLLVNVTYLQAVHADDLRNHQGNPRVLYKKYNHKRGPIVVDGHAVAKSVATDDRLKYKRVYPHGKLYSPATGYYSVFGSTGVEQEKDDVLSGADQRFFVNRLTSMATGKEQRGGSVVLTLDSKAQRAAYEGLQRAGGGAAVALDPQTGAILAMASVPTYDPNRLNSHDSDEVKQNYEKIKSGPHKRLLNKAIGETYFPGSTFKIVVSAAALSTGNYTPSTMIPAPHRLPLPHTDNPLNNFEDEVCSPDGKMSLADALKMSCNTAFASLGMELGQKTLREQAEKFGFNDNVEMPMETTRSNFPEEPIPESELAKSAIGQQDVKSTPLQMAMVASAVADNGTLMEPYLVDEVKGPDLSTVKKTRPEKYSQAMSSGAARQLTGMMKLVVAKGTGTAAQIPGVTVAGKTGTAENGPGNPVTGWFTSFAPAKNPQVAVAVVVPDAGETGGVVAAPIAKDMMEAVLQR